MTTTTELPPTARSSETSVPLHELLDARWSPRAFDPDARTDDDTLTALLEAARWAPSSGNAQPRRFIAARRGTATFDAVVEHLMGFNQVWARNASVLVVSLTAVEEGNGFHRWAEYDLGLATGQLVLQAHALGLQAHQMGGIDVDGLRAAFDLPEGVTPVVVTALGVVADASSLEEVLAEREVQPRTRLPLSELVLRSE